MNFKTVVDKLYRIDRIKDRPWCIGYITALIDNELIELNVYKDLLDLFTHEKSL